MTKKIRKAVVVTTIGALMAVGGFAIASWLATGTGDGYSKATSAKELTTVDASAKADSQLYPGGTGDLTITIANPNPYPVRVTDVAGNGTIVSDAGAACDAATGVTYTDQSKLALDVDANSSATFTLEGTVHMSNASDSSCQGAIFTIPVELAGASNA